MVKSDTQTPRSRASSNGSTPTRCATARWSSSPAIMAKGWVSMASGRTGCSVRLDAARAADRVGPRGVRRRSGEPVSLADIAPTIVGAAGVTTPKAMKGRDDRRDGARRFSERNGESRTDEIVDLYAETEYPRVAAWSPLQALTDGRWKAIKGGGATAVYDLQSDPREERDVAPAQPSIAAAMAARIDTIRQRGAASEQRAPFHPTLRTGCARSDSGKLRGAGVRRRWSSRVEDRGVGPVEDALAALNLRRADAAVAALSKLAAENPDAAVFRALRRALLEERSAGTGA